MQVVVALLLNALCWDAVTRDCRGGPETVAGYSVVTASALLAGWTEPTADVPEPQPIYAWGPGPSIPDVPASHLCVDMGPAPPPFGVYYYRPEPFDQARNRGDQQPCP